MVSLRFEVMKFPMLASPPSMTPEVISRILTDVHFHTQVWRACKTKITCLFLGRTRTRSNGWAFHARTFWPKQAIYLKPSANIGAIACFLGKCMRLDLFVLVTFISFPIFYNTLLCLTFKCTISSLHAPLTTISVSFGPRMCVLLQCVVHGRKVPFESMQQVPQTRRQSDFHKEERWRQLKKHVRWYLRLQGNCRGKA